MRKSFIFYFVIIVLLLSCSPNQTPIVEDKENYKIPELMKYYESLELEAQKWSSDAYLYEVDIPIGKKTTLLTASFNSPTRTKESIQVVLDLQSRLSVQKFRQDLEILQEEPITPSKFKIDSQEALNILVEKNQNSIDTIKEMCGSLKLSRLSTLPDRPITWVFLYRECGSVKSDHSYLDPITGTIFEP